MSPHQCVWRWNLAQGGHCHDSDRDFESSPPCVAEVPLIHHCYEPVSPRVITSPLCYSNTYHFPSTASLSTKSRASASLLIYALAAFHHGVSAPCVSLDLLTVQCHSVQCTGCRQGKERQAPCCSTCKKLKNVWSKLGFRSSRYAPQKKCKMGIAAYECVHSQWSIFMVNRVNGTKSNVCPRKAWECLLITYHWCFSIAAVNEHCCSLETSIPGRCLPLPSENRRKALKELWSHHRHPCDCKLH